MKIYADTSLFVSLYLQDAHFQEAQRCIASHPRIWLTPLHRAEWTHAVAQHVFHRKITSGEAQQVYRAFERDRRAALWAEVELPGTVYETCIELARSHVARLGARTLDTLHVATATALKAEEFWTFDLRQVKLAKAAGLKLVA